MAAMWEHFSHPADVGIRGVGPTLAEALAQCALALTALVADPTGVAPRTAVPIACAAENAEALLVDWLNALIYEMSVRRMLFSRFEVELDGARLAATAWGEPIDPVRHQPAVEVKAATYHALRVARRDDGNWMAQCVVDV